MRYRRLSTNGDFVFGQGGLDYLSDLDAVCQAVKTKLKLLLYEWWEDLEDGLPLFQQILIQRGNKAGMQVIELLVKERILQTPKVIKVLSYSDRMTDDRHYVADIMIDTEYGSAQITFDTEVTQ